MGKVLKKVKTQLVLMGTVVVCLLAVTAVYAKSNVDWRELERSYPTAGIGWDPDADHPGTQIFPNYLGSGVELTVNYSTHMWDETPNYYVEPDSMEEQDKHCHERYHGALRWTNNLNSRVGEAGGTPYGATYVEFVYDQPVLVNELEIGSLSVIAGYWEWIRFTAYDENNKPIVATTMDGSGVYCDNRPTEGPIIFDDGSGVYYAHGVAIQEELGYDHLIATYTDVPVKRIYAEFWKGQTMEPQGEHIGQLASITMHSIVQLPAGKETKASKPAPAKIRPFIATVQRAF